MSEARGGRIITFYSYKGGTGRSMALSNLAWVLAANRKRVLLIDWDLEAPGLHRYFHPFLADQELTTSRGLIDLLADYADQAIAPESEEASADESDAWYRERTDLAPYLQCINFSGFPEGGRIDLLPAGRQGAGYAVKLHAFDWDTFYERLGGGGFLEALKARLRAEYDYVLIDSRTGVSDTAGICTVQMPDILVTLFTYNNQSIRGALAVAQSALEARRRQYGQFSHETFRVFPVPSRADPFEVRKLQLRQAYARRLFAPLLEHLPVLPGREHNAAYWTAVEVPYNAYLNYEEVLSPLIFNPDDPKLPLASVLRLASAVTDGAVTRYDLPLSPEEKQRLLLAYERLDEETAAGDMAATRTLDSGETAGDALLRAADTLLGHLTQSQLDVASRLLLRLVRLPRGQEAAGLKRLLLPVDDLPSDERTLLDRFVQSGVLRLVRAQERSGAIAVEIADDALLSHWHQLSAWAEVEKTFLEQRYWIQAALEQWQGAGEADSLLLAAPLAEQADRLLATHTSWLTGEQIEFIKRSRDFRSSEAATYATGYAGSLSYGASFPPAPLAPRQSGQRGWLWAVAGALAAGALIFALLPAASTPGGSPPAYPAPPSAQGAPPAVGPGSVANATAGGFYIAGEQSLAAGRLDEALGNFDTALKLNATFPEALFKRALAYQLKKDSDKAVADLSAGLQLRPEQADARLLLAGLLADRQDKLGAAKQYQAALALNLSPAERQQASLGLERLNPPRSLPQVYLHINNGADYAFAEKLAGELQAGGAETRGIQVLAQANNADVRYANLADERLARQIRDRVQKALDRAAYKRQVELLYIGNSARNVPLGRIEVWLPALSAGNEQAPLRKKSAAKKGE